MAVQYVLVERGKPGNPITQRKFYAQAKSKGSVTLRHLAKRIADISTISTIDTLAVLEALLQVIPEEIANGNIVRLGEFGNFMLTIKGEGAETEEGFTSSNIKSNRLSFRPGKEFKQVLNRIIYEKAPE